LLLLDEKRIVFCFLNFFQNIITIEDIVGVGSATEFYAKTTIPQKYTGNT
jgi:hypothetical protein